MINVNEDLFRSIAFGTIDDVVNNLNDGANPNYNPRGTPPLFLSLYENKMDIFYLLLEHPKIDINIKNIMGNSIFAECLSQDLHEILDKLINNENIISQSNSKGEYPLHLAISYQNIDVVKNILTKYPENIDIKDSMGNTPLIIASKIGNEPLIKAILAYNPNLNIKNKFDKDAFFYLERKSLDKLIKLTSPNKNTSVSEIKDNTINNIIDSDNLTIDEDKGISTIKKRRNK